ncbi:MAG: hypothetical protein RR906_03215 [Acetivibrio sp.]
MNQNRVIKKAAVVGLSMALAAGQTLQGMPYRVSAAQTAKQETVFVNLDAGGNTSDITVSDWIKNVAAEASLKDSSDLTNISNVKGEETFSQNGKELVWEANKEDIYYQGKINKELPVSMKITYYMNGQEQTPEELVGKSGKFQMKMEYSNHTKEKVTVDGKEMEVKVPFAMITGAILPTEHFKNVEIDHGKIMSDADKNIVVGIALPGMEESLALSDDMKKNLELPSSLTITADAENFQMGTTFTLATSEFMEDVNLGDIDGVDELKDSMEDLKEASGKLVDGTKELDKGVGTLKEKSGEFTNGIGTLSNGLKELNTGAGTLENGITTYTKGAGQLAAGVKKLGEAIKSLPQKLTELAGGMETAKTGADQLVSNTQQLEEGMKSVNAGVDTVNTTLSQVNTLLSSIEGADKDPKLQKAIQTIGAVIESTGEKGTLKGGAVAVENGLGKLNEGQKSLQSGLGSMKKGVSAIAGEKTTAMTKALEQLTAGGEQLNSNSPALVKGARDIKNATGKLQEGGNQLNDGADKLTHGIGDLKEGSVELKDGMKEFNEDGIMKLYNLVNEDIREMFDRMDAISRAGENYNSFAGIDKEMKGTVRFIMETEEIK